MNYAPEEHEFVYEGFGLSKANDPDEGYFGYVYLYGKEEELYFSHSPCMDKFVRAIYKKNNEEVFELYLEGISTVSFGGYEGQRTIDIGYKDCTVKIFYNPRPRLMYID